MSALDTLPLPTFLVIGAQKSGTVWLTFNLRAHPGIFMPRPEVAIAKSGKREIGFFSKGEHFEKGVDWYRTNFEGWNGEPVVGETTPGYMMWHQGDLGVKPARIHASLPGVRLVALLRNPVDRAYSAFLHHMRQGRIPTGAGLLERLRSVAPKHDQLRLVAGGWYAASLEPYVERFGERLKVFLTDEMADDPERLYLRTLEHIGASTDFLPPTLRRIRHKGKAPETSQYAEDEGAPRPLTPEERAEAYVYFREEMERLEELLGRDLSIWRP